MKKTVRRRKTPTAYLWLIPAFAIFAMFTFYPFIQTIYKSFFIVDRLGNARTFVGLENYAYILKDARFLKSLRVSVVFALITVPLSKVVSLLLALLAKTKRKLSPVYETMFALPMVMASSVMAMIFQLLYLPTLGAINGIFGLSIDWLNDERYALLAIAIVQIWLMIGYDFIFLLAAVRSVPPDILESAELDGVTPLKRITKIYLPLVSPTMFYLICTDIPYCMLQMSLTNVLTEGGPNYSTMTVMQFIYKQFAGSGNYTNANPAAIITFLIILVFTLIPFIFEKKKVYYQ